MSKRNVFLVLLLLGLGGIYVFKFTNLFHEPQMEIIYQYRTKLGRGKKAVENAVTFSLNSKYQLTDLRVYEEEDFKTNKYPHALWHLVSESNSVPTRALIYGAPIEGMQPKVKKINAKPLQKDVRYVLLLEAGKVKGQQIFKIH